MEFEGPVLVRTFRSEKKMMRRLSIVILIATLLIACGCRQGLEYTGQGRGPVAAETEADLREEPEPKIEPAAQGAQESKDMTATAYGQSDEDGTAAGAGRAQDVAEIEEGAAIEHMPTEPGGPARAAFTVEEVSLHGTADDCWLIIEGKVYDVTGFISRHPGGAAIAQGCGTDATVLFETRPMGSGTPHSAQARSVRESYYIGDMQND